MAAGSKRLDGLSLVNADFALGLPKWPHFFTRITGGFSNRDEPEPFLDWGGVLSVNRLARETALATRLGWGHWPRRTLLAFLWAVMTAVCGIGLGLYTVPERWLGTLSSSVLGRGHQDHSGWLAWPN